MLQHPPQGKPYKAWLAVILWSLVIFATIPLARTIGEWIADQWGRELFTYFVLAAIAAALAAAVFYVARHRAMVAGSLLWLIAAAAVFAAYTIQLGKKSPEEAIHFVQYGVLGVLVFRALVFNRHDISIYFAAAVICGIIGTVDEVIQWLVPGRHWGLRDVWINFFAAALVQAAITMGLKPAYIAHRPAAGNLRFLCRLLAAAAALLGVCMLNTPERIAWYAGRVPGLGYLKQNDSVMAEYGFRYDDPDIGVFRSRLSPDALAKADRQRAAEAAGIVNIYRGREAYQDFLGIYTPVSDPFVHEARVHLFSRDVNFLRAMRNKEKSAYYARRLTEAYRENQIMEKYFPCTLNASAYVWPPEKLALAGQHLRQNEVFESWVSRHLITRFTEVQVGVFFALLTAGFLLLDRLLKRYQRSS